MLGQRQVLTVFLEPDNVKLVVSKLSGSSVTRIYAGQLNLAPEILHDAFIVDSLKFANQIKIALQQKSQLQAISQVELVMPPEKTFIKTLDAAESVDTFLRVLPYFKEELVLQSFPAGKNGPVTHVAFEKKLLEEFQQPFLDAGKKVTSVTGSCAVLASKFSQPDDYLLLLGFDKSIAVVLFLGGKISQLLTWPADVFAGRFVEFVRSQTAAPEGQNSPWAKTRKALVVGLIPGETLQKLQADLQLTATLANSGDIYDLVISASGGPAGVSLPRLALPFKLPMGKLLPLLAAIVIGAVLTIAIVSQINKAQKTVLAPLGAAQTASAPPSPSVSLTPTPKPADFSVRVLNGTLVAGEAGRLAEKLTALGFNVTETKNATSSGFVTTKLRVAPDVPADIVATLKSTLSDSYQNVVEELLTDDTVKVEIIIGKKKM